MKLRTLRSLFCCAFMILGLLSTHAQHTESTERHLYRDHDHSRCGHQIKTLQRAAIDKGYAQRLARFKAAIPELARQELANDRSATIITVPVVVHVIHNGEAVGSGANLSDAQIQAQIDILNEDFSATNPNYGSTPSPWDQVAGNPEIQFCLAIIDPDGNATNGITRHNITVTGSSLNDDNIESDIKPMTWWDSNLYYNIWTLGIPGTTAGGGTTGYAYYPTNGAIGNSIDGSVVDYRWFGGPGFGQSGYKTLTHETGHYLGLPHTFDDESCTADDGIADTPNIESPTSSLNPSLNCGSSFPTGPTSCGNEHMYVNYMDYVNDDRCYTSFSAGQINVMRSVLNGTAGSLGYGSRLPLANNAVTVCSFFDDDAGISAINTPGTKLCDNSPITPEIVLQNFGTNALTTVTITYQINGDPPVNFVWVDNLATGETTVVTLAPFTPPAGTFTFNVYTQNPNGNTDGQPSNDGTSISVTLVTEENIPLVDDFENTQWNPTTEGLYVDDYDNDGTTWERTTLASGYGVGGASALFNNYSTNVNGTSDAIVTPVYDFESVSGATLTFDVAYAPYNGSFFDSLIVYASTDCGSTFNQVLYADGNTGLATASATTNMFTPSSSEWRTETIDLSAFDGMDNLTLAFVNKSGYGNRLFLDNINVTLPCSLTLTPVAGDVSCNGGCDGTASVSVGNGTGTLSYTWDANAGGGTSSTVTGLCAGTYTVTVSDAAGCSGTTSVTLTEPNAMTLSTSGTNETSVGANDGTATATAGGGTPPYIYAWSNSGSTATISNLAPGTYTVTVFDNNNCQTTGSVTIDAFDCGSYGISVSMQDVLCNGENTGSASVTVTDGTMPYTYAWSSGGSSSTESSLAAGSYTVTVTDANGCTADASFTITEPDALGLTFTVQDETNLGDNDGSITANVSGGTAGYTYAWDPAVGNVATIENLAPGTYCVTVTDANNCSISNCATVATGNCTFAIDVVENNVSCNGLNDGSASVTLSNGVSPYTYLWSNASNATSLSNLAPGNYSVTVTDGNNCTASQDFTITEPAAVTVSVNTTNETSAGSNDGTATANPGGGGSYTYLWNNGGNTMTITGLSPGTYCVTITDTNNGCTAESCGTVNAGNVNCNFTIDVLTNDVSCNGSNDGAASVNLSDGASPYTYLWSTGANSTTLNNLSAGSYSVTVTDNDGCTDSENFTISEPTALTVGTNATAETSAGDNDGTATANASGGTLPYTYLWSNGETAATISNLSPGNYCVTVTDNNGCTAESCVDVAPGAGNNCTFTINVNEQNVTCAGESDGSASVALVNGTAPYTYQWSTGASTSILNSLPAGSYSVTVTDAADCTTNQSFTISEPAVLDANVTATTETGTGSNDGTASSNPTGGTAPYIFDWNNGATTASISNLAPGTYCVTVTDANNCTAESCAVVDPAGTCSFTIEAEITQITCTDANDGSIEITSATGTAPYEYLWSTGAMTLSISNLSEGAYTVTVTDANDCVGTGTYQIINPNPLQVVVTTTDETSAGSNDGTASANVNGGTPGFTYLWDTGATTASIINLGSGEYCVTVTDSNGCTATACNNVSPGDCDFDVSNVSLTIVSCNGGSDGGASLTLVGGTAPFDYEWSNGSMMESLTNVSAGAYSATVTDDLGCTATVNLSIPQPNAININPIVNNESSAGANDGAINLVVSGGTPSYDFAWSNSADTEDISDLSAGTYTVTITDQNDCSLVETITVGLDSNDPCDDFELTIDASDVTCNGEEDGVAVANVSGGTPPFDYEWNTGGMTSTLAGLGAGVYTVTVTDANDCEVIGQATITEPDLIVLMVTSTDETGINTNDGTASANASGGTGTLTYAWSNGGNTANISNLPPNTYTVTVTDDAGCSVTASTTVLPFLEFCDDFTAELDVIGISCAGANDASLEVLADGGTEPYVYDWSIGADDAMISNLSPGNYSVTITDANDCELILTYNLTGPAPLQVEVVGFDGVCGSLGAAQAIASGGVTPLSYLWSNDMTESGINGLEDGTYSVTITDANGCTTSGTTSVQSDNNVVDVNIEIEPISCNGDSDGAIDLSVVSGTAPFTFDWDNGATTEDLEDLPSGDYTIIVTDAAGCNYITTVALGEPMALSADIESTPAYNGNDGSATVQVEGGTTPYTYAWNTGELTATITGLPLGMYFVTVTDNNGCEVSTSVSIGLTNTDDIDHLTAFNLFPNPTQGELNISAIFTQHENLTVRIYDALGQVLRERALVGREIEATFNVHDLPAGTYFFSMTNATGSLFRKFVRIE